MDERPTLTFWYSLWIAMAKAGIFFKDPYRFSSEVANI